MGWNVKGIESTMVKSFLPKIEKKLCKVCGDKIEGRHWQSMGNGDEYCTECEERDNKKV